MAQITTWKWYISSMYTVQDIPNKPEYVQLVTWRVEGTDGSYIANVGNNAQFTQAESGSSFIPYQNLTEEVVLDWVKDQLGADGIAFYEAKAQAEIDAQASPAVNPTTPEYTPLPWAQQGGTNV
jgi:2-hydroxychromene-2-carboxylate isomerase